VCSGLVFAWCLAGWGLLFGLVVGFFNGITLRFRTSAVVLSVLGGCLSFAACCCFPGFLLYRWLKSVVTPDMQVGGV
jgi:hypothetical protein